MARWRQMAMTDEEIGRRPLNGPVLRKSSRSSPCCAQAATSTERRRRKLFLFLDNAVKHRGVFAQTPGDNPGADGGGNRRRDLQLDRETARLGEWFVRRFHIDPFRLVAIQRDPVLPSQRNFRPPCIVEPAGRSEWPRIVLIEQCHTYPKGSGQRLRAE
jgi:hypothetical protein